MLVSAYVAGIKLPVCDAESLHVADDTADGRALYEQLD